MIICLKKVLAKCRHFFYNGGVMKTITKDFKKNFR